MGPKHGSKAKAAPRVYPPASVVAGDSTKVEILDVPDTPE
jgi:hypothetical protein